MKIPTVYEKYKRLQAVEKAIANCTNSYILNDEEYSITKIDKFIIKYNVFVSGVIAIILSSVIRNFLETKNLDVVFVHVVDILSCAIMLILYITISLIFYEIYCRNYSKIKR